MTTLSRQAFMRLMGQMEDLEDAVDACQAKLKAATKAGDDTQVAAAEKELTEVTKTLRERREELARLSAGCGRPHHH